MAFGGWVGLAALAILRTGIPAPGSVTLAEGVLRVERRGVPLCALPCTTLREGWVVLHGMDNRAEVLEDRGRVLSVSFFSEKDARAWLEAVGFAPRKVALRLPFGAWGHAVVGFVGRALLGTLGVGGVVTVVLALGAVFQLGDFSWLLLVALALWLGWLVKIALDLSPATTVAVGADGVLVSTLGGRRFVGYGQVRHVAVAPDGVTLELYQLDGTFEAVRATGPCKDNARVAEAAVREALGRWQERPSLDNAALERGGRPFAVWRDALRGVLAGGTFRSVGAGPEALVDVAADPAAQPLHRVAAALALADADEASRQRVRIALDACVDESLRTAVQGALHGDLDEDTLNRLEREAALPSR
jgi:hypothetical protein